MGLWRFMDYCSDAGNNLIEEWYMGQSAAVQAAFDATLLTLSITEQWHGLSEFKMLGKRYPALGEIRFKVNNVHYRPAGSFGFGAKVFVIWVCCSKKQRVYAPPNAFDLAIERRSKYLNQGRGSLHERLI